jgi:hypothetical protein
MPDRLRVAEVGEVAGECGRSHRCRLPTGPHWHGAHCCLPPCRPCPAAGPARRRRHHPCSCQASCRCLTSWGSSAPPQVGLELAALCLDVALDVAVVAHLVSVLVEPAASTPVVSAPAEERPGTTHDVAVVLENPLLLQQQGRPDCGQRELRFRLVLQNGADRGILPRQPVDNVANEGAVFGVARGSVVGP